MYKNLQLLNEALLILYNNTKAEIIVSSFSHHILKGYLFTKPKELDWTLITKFDYIHLSIDTVKKKQNLVLFNKIILSMNIWTFKNNAEVIKVQTLYQKKIIYSYISDKSDLQM